ncbi:HNH endonuclease signature motif containing protein [Phycicoccus sonneratiae]|uniref:HNH endonuclease n=1 Tax=Phycicoccus sonneratiae TaxID=2807628 RepID=A0ABS2CJ86_9MICO|nr:HNH endonuclease signature motif containing protein [Phycicoccus sonneraticus]MBM6399952.1 HNH endonuclease [Phycicoccus sonneraticus]
MCDRVDRARAKALTDLVTQQASIDVQVTLTTTAGACGAPELDDARSTDLVAAAGVASAEPVLVERGWLSQAIAATNCRTSRSGRVVMCDPATGALLDPDDALATDTYRPGAALVRFVRARDGHCRFPGCHVSARYCDLDHVRPFPAGPTSAANLVCLCRRHHRIKQRPGWRAVLHPDATMTWTDPTGRVRTTAARDHRPVVLPDRGADRAPPAVRRRGALPDGPHSTLEHHLEHHPPPRAWVIEYRPRDGHAGRRCALPTGDPPF